MKSFIIMKIIMIMMMVSKFCEHVCCCMAGLQSNSLQSGPGVIYGYQSLEIFLSLFTNVFSTILEAFPTNFHELKPMFTSTVTNSIDLSLYLGKV